MGVKLDNYRKENESNIKVGSCLEFIFLQDTIRNNFDRLSDLIGSNSDFFDEDYKNIVLNNLNNITAILNDNIDLILYAIDTKQDFCKYHRKFY